MSETSGVLINAFLSAGQIRTWLTQTQVELLPEERRAFEQRLSDLEGLRSEPAGKETK